MEQVTIDTLDAFMDRYCIARGGEQNEDTDSEAMFVGIGKYSGAFMLTTGLGPMWVGLQNATARLSSDGNGTPYASVRDAVWDALTLRRARAPSEVLYSENAEQRLQWLAGRITENKACGDFLLIRE
jgi:hypothetical protein